MAEIIKKISAKTVCGKIKQEVLGKDGDDQDVIGFRERSLMRVIGVATGVRTGTTNFGEFVAFRGQFQATDLSTGKEFRSSQCFLPDDVTGMIHAQLASGDTKAVEFAFDIGIRPRDDLPIGYEYTSKPLLKPSENDPLTNLLAKLEPPKTDDVNKQREAAEKGDSKTSSKKGGKK